MARVFISHSSRDNAEADALFAWLKARGFDRGFLDIDKHQGIPPGARWEQKLYDELERAQAVVLLLTKNWFDSKWCFAEFAQARSRGQARRRPSCNSPAPHPASSTLSTRQPR